MKALISWLTDPSVAALDIDDQSRFEVHAAMLERKAMLREVFTDFHHLFHQLEQQYFSGEGMRIELGSGVSPMRDSYSDVLATDVVPSMMLDRVLDAENMELEDGSVRAIFAQNCFHHFPHPDTFFEELGRVLVPGGGAILLEPYHGPAAGFLYKHLFATEGFDKNYPSWETPVSGPMSGANQALSYIVFKRDREIFEQKYPCLKVVHQERLNNYMRYLLSGGLNFRQLCPNALSPVVRVAEWCLTPFNRLSALHHMVVLVKSEE